MSPRISLITLGVFDFKKSVAFYQQLGFVLSKHSSGDVAFFELKGTWLGLYPKDKLAEDAHVSFAGKGYQSISLAHNVKTKAEVDAAFQHVKKIGGKILKEPKDAFWGGYSGYFEDPDGYLWEVAWNPHFWVE
ncbi:VOC family protein [Candidatus Woesearchaeota archaeon]|nr:VOC family protein [Candidatus Woesearchaeota archaeon]